MKRRKYKYILLLVDWIVVSLAFAVSLILHGDYPPVWSSVPDLVFGPEFLLFAAFSPVIMYILQSNQLYRIHVHLEILGQAWRVLKGVAFSSIVLAIAMFILGDYWVSSDARMVVFYFLTSLSALLLVERILVMRLLFMALVKYKISIRYVLVVGGCHDNELMSETVGKNNSVGLSLVGFLDDEQPVGVEVIPGGKVLGKISDVRKIVNQTKVDEILICLEGVPESKYLETIDLCAQTKARLMVGSEQFKVITEHVYNENYGRMPVFGVRNSTPYMGVPVLKRVADVILSSIALVILAPVLLGIALMIKIDSRGPILFKQKRIGKDGQPFTFLKFRSMAVGSDDDKDRVEKLNQFIRNDTPAEEGTTKIVDERKITRVGRLIRRTSLDELPQLINVLRGEMSLVGPRPCLAYEWEFYDDWHKERHRITPGCTGVWQVFGRSKVGFRDTVLIDLFYMHNMSFRLDIWLVLKTIPVMLLGSGGK